MTPLRLSHVWYRRTYLALGAAALGLLSTLILQAPDKLSLFTAITLGLSGITVITSAVLIILAKKINSFWPALILFFLITAAASLVISQSDTAVPHYTALWALLALAAPIFGAYGWVPVFALTGVYVAQSYLGGGLTTALITEVLAGSLLPLGLGMAIWREGTTSDDASKSVKNLASQLSEVAAKSEIVINAIGDGVIAVDGKGVIQLINPAAQEILGWGKQDALLLNYKSILKLTDENNNELDAANDPVQQVLNNNQQARGHKITTVTHSGKKLSISLVASPIGDPGAGVIAVFRDITGERAEEREQAEFISTASHEMRTPVASIEGYLGLALNPNTATIDQRAHDFIMKAHEAAQHLGRLFQDLLDVSKSEDGRMQNVPRVVDIVPFINTIVEGLRPKAAEKGLSLVFVPTNASAQKKIMPVYYINLDNDHIREILDNLIENAIKYTPQGEVRVDVNGSEDKVVISIKDTGLGIPPEDIPHLFQKFYRVNNADRQAIGGTGLGLYLCRRLVEAMQGRLWVESVFGSGSTFFIELPRIDSQEAEQLKQVQDQQALQQANNAAPATPSAPVTQIPVTILDGVPAPTSAPAPIPAPVPSTPAPTPIATPAPTPSPAPVAPQPTATVPPAPTTLTPTQAQPQATPGVRPATTVPRGETLTREQINERVRQLEALAQQQRETPPTR